MIEDFWRGELFTTYGIFEKENGNSIVVHWDKIRIRLGNPFSMRNENLQRAFWNVCMDACIVSLEINRNYSIVDFKGSFRGPTSPNSGSRLYFTHAIDAFGYKKVWFMNEKNKHSVVQMSVIGEGVG